MVTMAMEATIAIFHLFGFLALALLTPGPNPLTCFAHSGMFGKKSNVSLITGMAIGLLLVELTVGLIVDSLSENSAAKEILHWIGMAFLAAMAIAMFRFDPNKIEITDSGGKLGLKTGIIMQFVNGKEWAFVIIIMSEYIDPLGGGIIGIATIISITVSVCVLAMIAWTFFGDRLNNLFSDPVKGSRVFKVCATLLTLLWLAFLVKGPVV